MHRGFRVWGMALAVYILMVVVLQVTIHIAAPKKVAYGCRGSYTVGFAGKERRYLASYYLKRSGDRFVLSNEDEFIASITSTAEDPIEVCVADVDWYERVSMFDTFSLFSASDTTRRIVSFSAREGAMGSYTPIGTLEHASIQACIGRSSERPGFVRAGMVTAAVPGVDVFKLLFKLLLHAGLFWCAVLWSPRMYQTIRWWLLPSPKRVLGCCVHCKYPTIGLTTPICPECGKRHGCSIQHEVEVVGS